jgi:hypothetical protein
MLPEWDESNQSKMNKCKQQAYNQLLAYTYMDNCEQNKYGSLLTGLNTQQLLGNSQYPTTLTEANNVLSNHGFDNVNASSSDESKKEEKDNKEKESKEQQNEKSPELSFAQMEGKCYCCGKGGHMSNNCCHKSKPKSELSSTKQNKKNHTRRRTMKQKKPQNTESASTTTGWAGVHIHMQFYQANGMRDVI